MKIHKANTETFTDRRLGNENWQRQKLAALIFIFFITLLAYRLIASRVLPE